MAKFVIVQRGDSGAAATFERVVSSAMCMYTGKKKKLYDDILPQWWLDELVNDFKYLLYYESEGTRKRHTRIDGFLVCSDKKLNFEGENQFLYVDVVCSKFRKGKALLLQAEVLAKELGYTTIALNALPHVVSYYRQLGYATAFDNCKTESRAQRNFRRVELNPYEHLSDGVWMTKCLIHAAPSTQLDAIYDRFKGQFGEKTRRPTNRFPVQKSRPTAIRSTRAQRTRSSPKRKVLRPRRASHDT